MDDLHGVLGNLVPAIGPWQLLSVWPRVRRAYPSPALADEVEAVDVGLAGEQVSFVGVRRHVPADDAVDRGPWVRGELAPSVAGPLKIDAPQIVHAFV